MEMLKEKNNVAYQFLQDLSKEKVNEKNFKNHTHNCSRFSNFV